MLIEKFVPLEFAANNYLLYDENLKCALLVDGAGSRGGLVGVRGG